MTVAEFMRRAALGRKADVAYDTQIVLQLSDVVRCIRAVHKQMVELQIKPPEEIWFPIMDEALNAMLRTSKVSIVAKATKAIGRLAPCMARQRRLQRGQSLVCHSPLGLATIAAERPALALSGTFCARWSLAAQGRSLLSSWQEALEPGWAQSNPVSRAARFSLLEALGPA